MIYILKSLRRLLFVKLLLLIPRSNAFLNIASRILILAGYDEINASAKIYSNISIRGVRAIKIGPDSYFGYRVEFVGASSSTIAIGANCDISDYVSFLTGTHKIGCSSRRAGSGTYGDIKIGSGVWIGFRSTILPGVHIGDGTIIGAGSVVVCDIPANVLAVGVPARVVKSLPLY